MALCFISTCVSESRKNLLLLLSQSVVSDSFATPWIVAYQATLSMGFSRQEYWSGLPFPSLGDRPEPGIKPGSPALDDLTSEPPSFKNRLMSARPKYL